MGTTTATQQVHQTGTHNNSLLFQNLLGNNQPRTSIMIHTLYNGASPAAPANIVEGVPSSMVATKQNASLGLAKLKQQPSLQKHHSTN